MSPIAQDIVRRFERGFAQAPRRVRTDPRVDHIESFTPAAVLVAITDRARPGMLLLHRPSTMRAHPGQVALPGGRIDAGEDAIEAALREANEELGIRPDDVQVIGTGDIYRTGTGYEITPVLGIVPADIPIHPNPAEVAQWFEVPIDFVLDGANHVEFSAEYRNSKFKVLEMIWNDTVQDHRIWGVTAAIISNLSLRLRWGEDCDDG